MSEIHIGTQGWNYEDWVGGFYPPGTKSSEFLDLYVRVFDTVEVDSTFYAVPAENALSSWIKRAPAGFAYSLKLPQQITHELRLQDAEAILEQFCARVRMLEAKLGIVLIQLPPDFSPRMWPSLEKFIPQLPMDVRFAVEFRDAAWLAGESVNQVLRLFETHGVALALVDSKWIPRELSLSLLDRPTAEFAYVRWMGPRELTDFSRIQINRDRELATWAEAFARLRQQTPVIFGYFNNHYQGHSPGSSNQFKQLLGLPVVAPESLIVQPSLF